LFVVGGGKGGGGAVKDRGCCLGECATWSMNLKLGTSSVAGKHRDPNRSPCQRRSAPTHQQERLMVIETSFDLAAAWGVLAASDGKADQALCTLARFCGVPGDSGHFLCPWRKFACGLTAHCEVILRYFSSPNTSNFFDLGGFCDSSIWAIPMIAGCTSFRDRLR